MSSVLKIKDPNTGNWISILAIKGDPGADAYEKAVEQGYTGTSEQFYASLAEVSTKANLTGGNIFTGNQTFDTNTLFVDSVNHRVGIGTTTPGTKLEVAGNVLLPAAVSIQFGTTWNTGTFSFNNGPTGAVRIDVPNGKIQNNLGKYLTASSNVGQFGTQDNYALALVTNSSEKVRVGTNGNVGYGISTPTAVIHIKAGTATASTAPLKLSPGVLLTTPEQGAIEFVDDSTNGHFYITLNTNGVLSRKEIAFKNLATTLLNGLMSSSDKTKLDGIENSANNYIHPATHSADIITDGNTNKVFTATEKTKLAGIESNANNYVHPATHSADIIVDGTTNKVYTAEEKTKLSGIATGAQVNNISDVNATDLTDGGATTLHKHSYNNLDDKPTIPNAQIQSDWNQSNNTLKDFIKNKPTIPTVTNDFTNTYKDALDRLSGFNSVTTLTSLPITKQSILASVTAATTISLAATLANGLILHVKVYNTSGSAITQTLPTTGSFESKKNDGTNKTSISIPAGGNAEISIWAINNKYIIKTDI